MLLQVINDNNLFCFKPFSLSAISKFTYEGGRPRVRDITVGINEMFVSYSIAPNTMTLSFETE